ncbi:MAG: 6-carboxytetrahydropterin synthase [Nitrosopumilaceae archaeon]|nr:6-carboxytetrahydropterin synthase [Nitrosopumilaceae archaeon]
MDHNDIILDSDFKYIDQNGNLIQTKTEFAIANLLTFLGHTYTYKHKTVLKNGKTFHVDFKTKYGLIEIIENDEDILKFKTIKREMPHLKIIGINNKNYGINEINSLNQYESDLQRGSIFIDEPSLSFDYAHILPLVKKCSILHGHTSSVFIELTGKMKNNLLIDFTDAKKIIKEAISKLDHKFFINKKYLQNIDDLHYQIVFNGPQGIFDLHVPKNTTYLLDGEATVENLSSEIIKILSPMLPRNIESVGVYIYEGYNKGAHIISHISQNQK